jgi:hypothetical protein
MTPVFVDTGAFVALVDRRDKNHAAASRCLRRLAKASRPLVTSTYVLDEAITMLRFAAGHSAAVGFGERLASTRWCRVHDVDDQLRSAAWEIFARYDDQRFSFTDCTSFALMRAMGVSDAFTFDRTDFAAAGMTTLPA